MTITIELPPGMTEAQAVEILKWYSRRREVAEMVERLMMEYGPDSNPLAGTGFGQKVHPVYIPKKVAP